MNGDGVPDLIVGSLGYDSFTGSAYVLFMTRAGGVLSYSRIGANSGMVSGGISEIQVGDQIGSQVSPPIDVNGDGCPDVAIGARGREGAGTEEG
jgi:hypothetical protein